MKSVKLGSQGLTVSALGFGCMGMSTTYGPSDDKASRATLARAVDLGVTLFDTAETYGPFHNERLVGSALAPVREQVRIATKVGFVFDDDGNMVTHDGGRPAVDCSPEHLRTAVDGSLGRLGVEQIDLLYLHRIDPKIPIEESVGAMADLVVAGKVGHIGLSEASAATIRRAHATHPLTAVQNEYSLFERGVEHNGVLEAARELGIGFVPYSPLGRGMLTGALTSLEGLDDSDFRRHDPRFQGENLDANLRLVAAIGQVAAGKGVLPSQLALAWLLDQSHVPIPGTRRIQYLEDNAASADIVLTDADRAALEDAAPIGTAVGGRYPAGMLATLDTDAEPRQH
ncbi:aldo/keto reductase [Streptomyces sp. NPDC001816]|uniref:aldo/keto reductase n=1 Tax=Streptomyces sp. NPDC001816 TaxID=3364612 RepID=UPI0036906DC3